jgi:hypothetical protein
MLAQRWHSWNSTFIFVNLGEHNEGVGSVTAAPLIKHLPAVLQGTQEEFKSASYSRSLARHARTD